MSWQVAFDNLGFRAAENLRKITTQILGGFATEFIRDNTVEGK